MPDLLGDLRRSILICECTKPEELSSMVRLTDGTQVAKQTMYSDEYLGHAILPSITLKRDVAASPGHVADAATLSLGDFVSCVDLDIPADVLLALRKRVHDRASAREEIAEALRPYFESAVQADGDYTCLGLEYTKDSAPSLTWDVDGRRTGLHVDTFYTCKLAERVDSPNRVCINIGPQDRYFLFCDVPITEMRRLLEQDDPLPDDIREEVAAITALFFRAYPSYPIHVLRVRPGECYIAPTEFLVHDGFVSNRFINCSASYFGKFKPKRPQVQTCLA